MRKILKYGFIAVVSCFCSCGETHIHEVVNRTKTIEIQTEIIVKKVNGNDKFRIVKMDGCEYIWYKDSHRGLDSGWGAGGLCHKANCKNH